MLSCFLLELRVKMDLLKRWLSGRSDRPVILLTLDFPDNFRARSVVSTEVVADSADLKDEVAEVPVLLRARPAKLVVAEARLN